jgi:hypothetical protein
MCPGSPASRPRGVLSGGGLLRARFSFYRGIRGAVYRSFDALIGPEIMNVAFLDLDQGKLTLPRVRVR